MLKTQKQELQRFGCQIACTLLAQDHSSLLFNNLLRLLQISKFKEIRKLILRAMPTYIKSEQFEHIKHAFGLRLLDSEPDVRKEAYISLINKKVKITDFSSAQQRLLIIKEGLSDKDLKVREACFQFIKQSIEENIEIEVTQ
jgi:hypothetical protein